MKSSFSRFRIGLGVARYAAFLGIVLACLCAALAVAGFVDIAAALAILLAMSFGLIGMAIHRTISGLRGTRAVLDRLARGDFDARIVGIDAGQIGALNQAVNAFADQADAFVRESRASLAAVAEQRYHRRIIERGLHGDFLHAAKATNSASSGMVNKITSFRMVTAQFEETVTGVAGTVASSSEQLKSTANEMAATAEVTSRDAMAVAAASEQASANVHTVAAAAEELSASISEISSQVSRSRDLALTASGHAQATDAEVKRLAEAGERIGEVVKLINDIASQTNLLALNATIEAARAGEAGKGFAVVANEVKHLASQTAKATEDITSQVDAVRVATAGVISAMGAIGQSVTDVTEAMVVVASAVEEQGAATAEIARNVEEASAGTMEVSSRIVDVTQAAQLTGSASTQVLAGANTLANRSDELRNEIADFLSELRKVL
jgi:methyl-accepting chemotaxis protein